MNHAASPENGPKSWKNLVAETRTTWLSATLAGGLLAFVLSLATAQYWEATQAIVVRQDASASHDRPGKFADLYEMRTVQETILELARSRQVVSATLSAVDEVDPTALSADDLDAFRSHMEMTPPGGAEFGKTEVFYLTVQDNDRQRALHLVARLCEQLDLRLRELRAEQARGMIAEIEGQLAAAEQMLAAETDRLAQFETSVGADLGELRMLHSAWSGQSDLRQRYVELGADHRRAQQAVQEIERLLELLETTQDDPNQLASLPNSLLTAQPGLSRLKEGLVDAQLRTSRLQGARSAEHPRVVAAVEAEASMRRDLIQEILAARHAAEAELQLRQSRQEAAVVRLQKMEKRLANLARQRAQYSNLVAASESSQASVDELRGRLAAAQALLGAAENSSVLNLVDLPETGPAPIGPSHATILLAGLLSGLAVGAGFVFYQQAPEVAYVGAPVAPAPAPEAEAEADASTQGSSESESPVIPEWWETPTAKQLGITPPNEPLAKTPADRTHGDASTTETIRDDYRVPYKPSQPLEEFATVSEEDIEAGNAGEDASAEEYQSADEPVAAEEVVADDEVVDAEESVASEDPATGDESADLEEAGPDGASDPAEEHASDEEQEDVGQVVEVGAAHDEQELPRSESTATSAPEREPAASGGASGFASFGLGSTDLKDAMRDAFLPTQ